MLLTSALLSSIRGQIPLVPFRDLIDTLMCFNEYTTLMYGRGERSLLDTFSPHSSDLWRTEKERAFGDYPICEQAAKEGSFFCIWHYCNISFEVQLPADLGKKKNLENIISWIVRRVISVLFHRCWGIKSETEHPRPIFFVHSTDCLLGNIIRARIY